MDLNYSSVQISEEMAAKLALNLFRIKGKIKALPGEYDFNFRINTGQQSFLLKISRPGVDKQFIEFQQALLEHLSKSSLTMRSPKSIADVSGNFLIKIKDGNGHARFVRLLTWMEGRIWSSVNPVTDELLLSLGEQAGVLTKVLQSFDHPVAHRYFEWDTAQSNWTVEFTHLFHNKQKEIISFFQKKFQEIAMRYSALRKSVVHNDVNDNNIIVSEDLINPKVNSIIDYGDAIYTQTINDLANTISYAVMNKPDVLSTALPVVKAYHEQFPLLEEELEVLYTLVAMRLVISVTKSAINKQKEPGNTYLLVSEKAAWEVLEKWKTVNSDFAHFSFRKTCGFPAHPQTEKFKEWAKSKTFKLSQLFPTIGKIDCQELDLGMESELLGHESTFNDLPAFEFNLAQVQAAFPDKLLAGGYLETRPIYSTDEYKKEGNCGSEYRTVHLGIDFWLQAGTPVHALFDGKVVLAVNDAGYKEYGGLVILKHRFEGITFYTLYGHQSVASVEKLTIGDVIAKGERISDLGNHDENGRWGTHLHFQIMLSMLGNKDEFPGVAYPAQKNVWADICPDPNLLFKSGNLNANPPDLTENILSYRKNHLGKSLSLSYTTPLFFVRGSGTYLMDITGRKYLDTVNNVAHVGHEHQRVVKAGQNQMAILNTNTRYLHKNITAFAEALLNTFPRELSVVHFVNSGSEANELAMRMARTCTGQKDMIAVEVGYHGNTSGCVDVSSYKFDGKGGVGAPGHTHIVPLPDAFRGIYQGENTGQKYAAHIQQQLNNIQQKGRNVAAFICESIISCGGQIELPEGYLKNAFQFVKNAGGLCIMDEVQVGCGRVGSNFWGFQLHDLIPDIVTIGKPLGNGHPLAAVVCTQAVADTFANGMEYFNTFGGNPVSCAIGLEVLNVIKDEKLQENAFEVGNYLKSELKELQAEFPIIGDVRGQGLFLGFELTDEHKKPLAAKASHLANRMKDLGILMSTDGKDDNVLKIKPPMVFSRQNAEELLIKLSSVFREDFMKH